MKYYGKTIIIGILSICAIAHCAAKTASQKMTKAEYAEEYKALKKSLDLPNEELTATETLEAIAVKFAKAFDETDNRLGRLSDRTKTLEIASHEMERKMEDAERRLKSIEERLASIEERVELHDKDLTKIFNWADKIDGEIHNEFGNGIGSKVAQLDKQVNNWCDGLEKQMENLRSVVNSHAADIRSLFQAINSMR